MNDRPADAEREAVRTFRDRGEAGRRLATCLQQYRNRPRTVVLGLPRGGVVPAAEIAAAPEYAIGAVAEGGEPYLNEEGVAVTGATDEYIRCEVERQRAEIRARQERFRHGRPLVLPEGATAILVDDGVATGSTTIAAIRALGAYRLERLVLAVPVAPPDTVERLSRMVDELVVLATPTPFGAVGAFYERFSQVSDAEVEALLAGASARPDRGAIGARGRDGHTSSSARG
jgi:putative phosphoribosyl transferase